MAVQLGSAGGSTVERPCAVAQGTRLVEALGSERFEVFLTKFHEVGATDLRQHQEVIHEPGHSVCFVEEQSACRLGVGAISGIEEFEVTTQDRQRRTEFMARIVK